MEALLGEIRKALADVEGGNKGGAQKGREGEGKVERLKAPQWQI